MFCRLICGILYHSPPLLSTQWNFTTPGGKIQDFFAVFFTAAERIHCILRASGSFHKICPAARCGGHKKRVGLTPFRQVSGRNETLYNVGALAGISDMVKSAQNDTLHASSALADVSDIVKNARNDTLHASEAPAGVSNTVKNAQNDTFLVERVLGDVSNNARNA